MELKPAGEDSSGTPWRALTCSLFSQMHALGLLAWSPEVCCWCLQQAQGCLETSQPEVTMMWLTWTPGMTRERWAWLFERKWSWAWRTRLPFLRPEAALTSLFCSHYLLWYRGKGEVRAEGVCYFPLHHPWEVRLHQGTVWSTGQYLLSIHWAHIMLNTPWDYTHLRGKRQHSKPDTLELNLGSIIY